MWETGAHFSCCLFLPPVNTQTLFLLLGVSFLLSWTYWNYFLTETGIWAWISQSTSMLIKSAVLPHSWLWEPHLTNVLSPPLRYWFSCKGNQRPRGKSRVWQHFPGLGECYGVSGAVLSHVAQPAGLAPLLITQGPPFHFCLGKRKNIFRKFFPSAKSDFSECFWCPERL